MVTIAPSPASPFAASAIYGTCASELDGQLFCWGNNASGEIGDGTTEVRTFPTAVKNTSGTIFLVNAGSSTRCGRDQELSAIFCWGTNAFGSTGQGGFSGITTTPQRVATLARGRLFRSSVGPQTTCTTVDNGISVPLYCWGNNAYGQLGTGSTETATNAPGTPVALGELLVSDVAVGGKHACAITNPAPYTLYCWGDGSLLGTGSTDPGVQGTPVAVTFPSDLPGRGLVAGSEHTCLPNYTSYVLYCWGSNRYGQTGTGGPLLISVPTRLFFPGLSESAYVQAVAAGDRHTCAIVAGGTYCWGNNDYGQLGTGDVEASSKPVRIVGDKGFSALAINGSTTCGLVTADNSVWCWGYGLTGELGNGTSGKNSLVPVKVLKP